MIHKLYPAYLTRRRLFITDLWQEPLEKNFSVYFIGTRLMNIQRNIEGIALHGI